MSASILWRPKGNGTRIGVSVASDFAHALGLPRTFSAKDYDFLNGVRAGRPAWDDPIREILNAISIHNEIEVFAEY